MWSQIVYASGFGKAAPFLTNYSSNWRPADPLSVLPNTFDAGFMLVAFTAVSLGLSFVCLLFRRPFAGIAPPKSAAFELVSDAYGVDSRKAALIERPPLSL